MCFYVLFWCVCICAHVWIKQWQDGEIERQLPKESWKGKRNGVRMGGVHPSLVVQPCPRASSPSPEASASLEQPFKK